MQSSYSKIINIGCDKIISNDIYNDHSINPVFTCMGNTLHDSFMLGATSSVTNSNNEECQSFMSDYCALNWDNRCEALSHSTSFASNSASILPSNNSKIGEILVFNTATKKYLSNPNQIRWSYTPFNPVVADSPLVRKFISGSPKLQVDSNIDNDVLMDKILLNPEKYLSILQNIYQTMKNNNTLDSILENTKLGLFFRMNSDIFN